VRIVIGIWIGLLVIRLVGQLIGFAIGLLWARRRSRYLFRRQLRRNGLSEHVIEEVAWRYHRPGLIRELIRAARS
jgi:SOS response regulatory protein OraA/RecX